MSYNLLKQKALESVFSRANDMQKKAIFKINGAVLIIAGAGSGKTTVLVNRIANMMRFGNAYHDTEERELTSEQRDFLERYPEMPEKENTSENTAKLAEIVAVNPVKPWNILAITFTNKAANELRTRLVEMIGGDARKIVAATFHSACVRILRREIEALGYRSSFTIYDEDDSKRLIKEVMKRHNIDEKFLAVKTVKNTISRLKDKLITPGEFAKTADETADAAEKGIAVIYADYQRELKSSGAVDFDDIIFLTVKLFEQFPDVLEHYRNLYKYIMVDEYQDTNVAQYKLISLLAGSDGNLGVVGDDDQSIYRFRGATVENILSFEKQYKDCEVIRLEQNYRSTVNILNAANAIIDNNQNRKKKHLWSDLGDGEKIELNLYTSEAAEAKGIADIIKESVENGAKYSDHALLYRNNALSRSFESALTRAGIPYKVVGGLRFFDRKEIRDIMAYLSLIDNPYDVVRFRRVINEPKRGIGDATVDEVVRIAQGLNISPVEVCANAEEYETIKKKAGVLKAAANLFEELDQAADELKIDELIDAVALKTGYMQMLRGMGEEGVMRIENVNELKSNAALILEEDPEAELPDFLEQTALAAEVDNYDENADCVALMTMHSAKGLEFPTVFFTAAEENIFPSALCRTDPAELEEERRLAYVTVTRAKKRLVITHSRCRMLFGKTSANRLSRFVAEIPEELLQKNGEETAPMKSYSKPERHSFLKEETAKMKAAASVPQAGYESFAPGDRVKVLVFGEGTVIDVKECGNDAMITIEFDTRGTKKVMRNNTKLKKI